MTPEELLGLGKDLVDQANKRGVKLRLLGYLAVYHHTEKHRELIDLMKRVPTHDIDFMGYSKEQNQADKMFKELGYKPDPAVAFSQEYGIKRLIYHHPEEEIIAEIFLDELSMAHTLDFRGRLEMDSPTISLVDLLLSKLQIHQITEKDIQDTIILLAEHELGAGDREQIDVRYLLKLTKDDWGLYYTATGNMKKVREWVDRYEVIDETTNQAVKAKVDQIFQQIEADPKSLKWKMRAKVGTKAKWYQVVGQI